MPKPTPEQVAALLGTTTEHLTDHLTSTLDAFLSEVDPDEIESDDLAEVIINALRALPRN